MGTKNNPGAHDCYANAGPDEPLFVLLGRDKHAPTLVWLWAALRELDGEAPAKVAEARNCVLEMIIHQQATGRRPIGIAQSVLAGVMELMRAANQAVVGAKNFPTALDEFRAFLCASAFEAEPGPPATGTGDGA